jgi:hypothetical protein
MHLNGEVQEVPGIRIALVQFQKFRRNANRMRPGQTTVKKLSVIIDVFNMFVMPETPADSKTMATKYDGVAVLTHPPEDGISEARPARLARLYRRLVCSKNTRTLQNGLRAIIPPSMREQYRRPFCWKIDTSTCKREWWPDFADGR